MIFINTPPPTISGNLHIGHIFSYTHIDAMARAMRYLGKDVHFPIGFDCNGIPSENLLRQNSDKNIDNYILEYIELFQNMGFEMDFENPYKTIDLTKKANDVFRELKKLKLIYEAEKEVWFDTALKTPLSDNEVIEQDGQMIGEVSKKPVVRQITKQFFLKTVGYKKKFLQLSEEIRFHPEEMRVKLTSWIKNLEQDWCISRDRAFGIKIDGTEKVFDTWFVSALKHCLFSEQSDFHFQGHEIIRSWCFYSLVMSMHLKGLIPFKHVFISGWCIGKDGQKLSKSKGNFINPNKLIEQYGVNPIRFWALKARWGADTFFDENVILNGRRLMVKLENAERFFILKAKENPEIKYYYFGLADGWFDGVKQDFRRFLRHYEIAEALNYLYDSFFIFCSQRIEACKKAEVQVDFISLNYALLGEYKKMFQVFFNLSKKSVAKKH